MVNWRENDPRQHIKKLRYVAVGYRDSWKTSSGFRIHLLADLFAFALGGVFTVSLVAWGFLTIAFVLKTAAEPLNSAIEELADQVFGTDHNPTAKRVKDFAAAGVFSTVLGSFILWSAIFIPEVYHLAT